MADTTTRERELRNEGHTRPAGFVGDEQSPRASDGKPRAFQRETTVGLVTSIAQDAGQLFRQELELARTEIGEKVDQLRKASGELAGGAAIAYAGLLFLLMAAFFGLDVYVEEPWLSALIVGGVVILIGLAMLAAARRNLTAASLKPEKTVRSLEEDAELVRDEARRMTT